MQHWPAEAIWEAVSPTLPGFTVEVLPSIDSTNSELVRRARAGHLEPILLVAQTQTAGRGRLGRDWVSQAAPPTHSPAASPAATQSLTFSLGLPLAPADWSGLSLAVGLSVVHSLHPALQLKWPNDVWLQGRKVAGILIETVSAGALRYAVIGIGINITAPLAQDLRTPPAGLRDVLPQVQAPDVLQHLMLPLVQAIEHFCVNGFAPLVPAYAARDLLRGHPVVCSDGTQGLAQGVNASGALQVLTDAGLRSITSAEISVRPTLE
jgi:BirA family transcriptional regulator, biotin operon repressor / biotin---[acetyl-CoA-carboxylase] ligase